MFKKLQLVSMYLHELSLVFNIYESSCPVTKVSVYCKPQVHSVCSARLWPLPVPLAALCPAISGQYLLSIIALCPYWLSQICTELLFFIPIKNKTKNIKPKTPFDEWLYSWMMKSTHTGGVQEHPNTKCSNASISLWNVHFSFHVTGSAYLMSDLQA